MSPIPALALASFQDLVRRPVWLILGAGGVLFILILAHANDFALGEESRQVRQSTLAWILAAGIVTAVSGASSSLAREIRSGTALVVLSKPVDRLAFLLGKFLGLAAAVASQSLLQLLAALLAVRMAHGADGRTDLPAVLLLTGAVLAALLLAAASSYFLHRGFLGDAALATPIAVTLAFLVINALSPAGSLQPWGTGLDPSMIPAVLLILAALMVFTAVALALSTHLDVLPTLACCFALLTLGLLSDHLFAHAAAQGSRLASLCHALVPNWQVFWIADALDRPEGVPASYVLRAFAYAAAHLVAALSLAWSLFSRRELA